MIRAYIRYDMWGILHRVERGGWEFPVVRPTSNFQLSTQGPHHCVPHHIHIHTLAPIAQSPFRRKCLLHYA